MIGTDRLVQARLDPATAADLDALVQHLRVNATSVVRLAIAEFARAQGVGTAQESAGKGPLVLSGRR